MTEIISIFYQFFIFLIIFSFPLTPRILRRNLNNKLSNINFFDTQAINIIFFLYVCLSLSFFNIDLKLIFKIYFIAAIIFGLYNLKKINPKFTQSGVIYYLVFFLLIISIFFLIAQDLKLEWDGHHWIEKALIFLKGEDILSLKNVSTHPEYPHLGSFLWAFFWKNSYLELEYFGRFFYVYIYIISIFSVINFLNFKNLFINIFGILFIVLLTFEPYLFAGYQEYLIFSILVISSRFIMLLNFNDFKNFKLLFLIILILYLNSWVKDEGLVYFLIFSLLLTLFIDTITKYKLILIFSIFILTLIQYILQKYLIGLYDFPQMNSLNNMFLDLSNLSIIITKSFKILSHSIISFIKHPLWILIVISLFVFFQKKNILSLNIKYFLICLLFSYCFLFSVFFTFNNFDFMLRVSLDRLLFQNSGFFLMLFLIILKDLKISNK
jgi:hypothetical protein